MILTAIISFSVGVFVGMLLTCIVAVGKKGDE